MFPGDIKREKQRNTKEMQRKSGEKAKQISPLFFANDITIRKTRLSRIV